MSRAITADSTIVASKGAISATVEAEVVILDTESGIYYGLNPVGTRVWNLVQGEPLTLAEICDCVTAEFDVERERCERDLIELLGDLDSNGLIEVGDGTPA
jgi:hypothetical protein